MDFTEHSPVILSLCPGMLGLERGLEAACRELDWMQPKTAAYVEIEAFVIWNLVKQMESGLLAPAPIHSNIKTFDGKPFRNKIHGILGGYPCQPFSLAGERKGTEDPRHLWPFISRIIEATQPVFCFFENVAGHLTLGYGEVYRSLRDLGYTVEAGIYTAEEIGAPHQRERLFILAIKKELANSNSVRYTFRKLEKLPTERGKYVLCNSCTSDINEMANAEVFRMEGSWRNGIEESQTHGGETILMCNSGADRWPAKPGQNQHEWEAPRVESSVGFTAHGYNFREDLLRLAGNGVVSQTARRAFTDLIQKFKF